MEPGLLTHDPALQGGSVLLVKPGSVLIINQQTGTVSSVDVVYRLLKINAGRSNEKGPVDEVIKFDDLLDVSGSEIVDIDKYLGIEDFLDEYGEPSEYDEYSENK